MHKHSHKNCRFKSGSDPVTFLIFWNKSISLIFGTDTAANPRLEPNPKGSNREQPRDILVD